MFNSVLSLALTASLLSSTVLAHPQIRSNPHQHVKKATSDRYVFAHFMVGFVNSYTQADWARDVELAHSKGIDGFALNCDGQDANDQQLTYAYAAASAFNTALPTSSTPFTLFISPDFVHYSHTDPGPVANLLKPWLTQPAQFRYEDKPFVSSFWGQGTDWEAVRKAVGMELYVVPYYYASTAAAESKGVDGLFSWYAWSGQNTNDVVERNITVDMDHQYTSLLAPKGKTYMAPVSPWFYAHLPAATGYPKNNYLYSDTLWTTRWQQILDLSATSADTLKFVEIITWNDWTESSQISPYRGTHNADGNYLWSEGFDHSALMDLMGPYIAAYKKGEKEVTVEKEMLVYWYRPSLKSAMCDDTDTVKAKPTGWDMAEDSIFVAAVTTGPAKVTVTSGKNSSTRSVDSAGIHVLAFPMGVGSQQFSVTTAKGSGSGKGAIEVSAGCYNGVYNFNILAGKIDITGSDGGTDIATGVSGSDSNGTANSTDQPVHDNSTLNTGTNQSVDASPSAAVTSSASIAQLAAEPSDGSTQAACPRRKTTPS